MYFVGLLCNNGMAMHGMYSVKRRTTTLTRRMCDYCGHYTGADDAVASVLWITSVHKKKY